MKGYNLADMRILITGGDGQLGRALGRAMASHDVEAVGRAALDVAKAGAAVRFVGQRRPEVVIHCAALTDTARCEREPEAAFAVNAHGTGAVAAACAQAGARMVAVSTNEVFDGSATTPYPEVAPTRPLNVYAASKLEGEELAASSGAQVLVVRTSWVYGGGERDFVAKTLQAARTGGPLRFVRDEVAAPTLVDDLAGAIAQLIEVEAPAGVYHLAGEGEASRYDWAEEIARQAGVDAQVESITTEELRTAGYDGPYKPPYSVLANVRARSLGVVLRDWREALRAHFARIEAASDG